ncbi:MAG: PhnD/SsuA/transferrin family substrate-binding protein [Hyphomicrobiales bacterium]
MAPNAPRCHRHDPPILHRRGALAGLAATVLLPWPLSSVRASSSVSFGLTPVFLDSDIELLALLEKYLVQKLRRAVTLVKRRTYQEITAMLLSGQLDAAWICDDPYVQHQSQLALLAVPLYLNEPLYQTYAIVNETSKAKSFNDIRGTVHAFSDPDSTSGYLVTRYLIALRHTTPAEFFRSFFFTYGHRNVVRAVAAGLAESGSIDGYVWDVMREREPELVNKTRVVYRSERLGFPPIVGLQATRDTKLAEALSEAFLDMSSDPLGREILAILELDGFTRAGPELYQGTLDKWLVVKAQV